jgi:site-specific DNA-methyltransferase (adenine-specific)
MGYHGGNVAEQYNTGSTDGRWPANTIITHSPDCETECVEGCPVLELDGQSGERPSGGAGKNQNSQTANFGGGKHSAQNSHASTGGASRFFTQTTYTEADWPVFLYYAKASKRERNQGLDELEERQTTGGGGLSAEVREDGSLETASAGGKYGSIKAKQSNIHPTVKPVELMRHLIRLVTPKGGTVLDPFLGSGTTAVAAILEGDNWVGCELTEDYWQIIEGRTEWAQEQAGKTLF